MGTIFAKLLQNINHIMSGKAKSVMRYRGTPPLTRFFGPGKPRYRRSILVLKSKNGEFISSKSTSWLIFTS